MSLSRFNALQAIENRPDPFFFEDEGAAPTIASYFGENVFGEEAMKKHLNESAYISVKASIQSGQKLSKAVADVIANGIREWAQEKGCTHFAHWFQPLTGKTA
jgi:glutamine synthetase